MAELVGISRHIWSERMTDSNLHLWRRIPNRGHSPQTGPMAAGRFRPPSQSVVNQVESCLRPALG